MFANNFRAGHAGSDDPNLCQHALSASPYHHLADEQPSAVAEWLMSLFAFAAGLPAGEVRRIKLNFASEIVILLYQIP
jgi:hypothetical protein